MDNKKRLIDYIRPYRKQIIFAAVAGIISCVLYVLVPAMISMISNLIQKQMFDEIQIPAIVKMVMVALCLALGGFVFSCVQCRIMTSVSKRFVSALRTDLDKKLDRLPLSYYNCNQGGDIMSVLVNDVDALNQALAGGAISMLLSVITLVCCVILMFMTNWIMAIGAIVSTFVGLLLMAMILGKTQPYINRQQEVLGEINGQVAEDLNGFLVIKAFGAEKETKEAFHRKNKEMYQDTFRAQFASGLMSPLMSFTGNLGYVVVCVIGTILIHSSGSDVTIVSVIAFILYVRQFTTPLCLLGGSLATLQPALAANRRIFRILNEEEVKADRECQGVLPEHAKGEVEFFHVKFGYEPGTVVIHDFSAHIPAEHKIAIVGPTGAGKSTLVNLLMGYFELDGGKITIDGVDISTLPKSKLRELTTFVPQDVWLFEGSIRDNIRYSTDISDERVDEIIKMIGLEHFVKTLPDGADTILDKNRNLSAGQRQLLTIGRAMAKPAPILILDEATATVDTRMEKIVQGAIDKLAEGKTTFVIAHRLSTIKNADVIFVMDNGDIAEVGNHEELLKKNGFYAKLYNSQFDDEEV